MSQNKVFGLGEVEPTDSRHSISYARREYMLRVRRLAPQVLRELAEYPYDAYVRTGIGPVGLWPITPTSIKYYAIVYGRNIGYLHRCLILWARRWNLEADWCLDDALWTIEMWRQFPQVRNRLDWMSHGAGSGRLNDEKTAHLIPPFELRKWEADVEFRWHYLRYAKSQIIEHIDSNPYLSSLDTDLKQKIIAANLLRVNDYCKMVLEVYLAQADSSGKPLWKLTESRAHLMRNLAWTIRVQVLGQSQNDIAMRKRKEASTVIRAVDDTLKLLGLAKRPDLRPGRQRGHKESPDSHRRSIERAKLLK
jgi:hypothetical protein